MTRMTMAALPMVEEIDGRSVKFVSCTSVEKDQAVGAYTLQRRCLPPHCRRRDTQ